MLPLPVNYDLQTDKRYRVIPITHSGVMIESHFASGAAWIEAVKESILIGRGRGDVCGGRTSDRVLDGSVALLLSSFFPPHLPP